MNPEVSVWAAQSEHPSNCHIYFSSKYEGGYLLNLAKKKGCYFSVAVVQWLDEKPRIYFKSYTSHAEKRGRCYVDNLICAREQSIDWPLLWTPASRVPYTLYKHANFNPPISLPVVESVPLSQRSPYKWPLSLDHRLFTHFFFVPLSFDSKAMLNAVSFLCISYCTISQLIWLWNCEENELWFAI